MIFDYFLVVLSGAIGAIGTFLMIHFLGFTTVRAACLATLFFVAVTWSLHHPFHILMQSAFLGSTFVGMTDKSLLGWKRVLAASLLFSFFFLLLIPMIRALKGSVETAAFLSSGIVYGLTRWSFQEPATSEDKPISPPLPPS